MKLHSIESCGHRVLGSLAVVLDDPPYLRDFECSRLCVGLVALVGVRVRRSRCCGGGYRPGAAQKVRVYEPTHMPKLRDDPTTRVVNRSYDRLPGAQLLPRP